ncbi:MAG: hypothetical protein RJA07_672 [Bacteroidota bacterium]|jgi:hypothetical protein
MSFFNSIISWFFKQRLDQIQRFMDEPLECQEQVLGNLISLASTTEWGEKYGYDEIESIADFKKRVPIQDYESLKPYIQRTMQGEQNLLWHSDIIWFAKSSGTTSDKSKFIPISQESMDDCHYKGGKDVLTIYCNNHPDTKIFSGKGLVMGGSHQMNPLNESASFGDLSAVLIQNMPWLGSVIQTPDLDVALMNDWEKKIEMMIATVLQQDITHIAGVPTWTMVLIQRILERTGKKNLLEVFPNLELYIHGGVSFTPYKSQFQQLIQGNQMNYYQTYNASEGFFGIQFEPNADDMLLMLDYGIFYEFIPAENMDDENPTTLQLHEVEIGKVYALVISTNGGLWRYKIGDTITFTSVFPFKIKVAGRTKNYINAFGEELMVHNADEALAMACSQTNAVIKDYTAAPIFLTNEHKGGHEWLIEFEKQPNDLLQFTTILDVHLQKINSDYEAKRQKDIALQMPVIHSLQPNTFYNWLKQKGKIGGQHKVPRLSNDRKIVEEILQIS